jgi:hypothetical protein
LLQSCLNSPSLFIYDFTLVLDEGPDIIIECKDAFRLFRVEVPVFSVDSETEGRFQLQVGDAGEALRRHFLQLVSLHRIQAVPYLPDLLLRMISLIDGLLRGLSVPASSLAEKSSLFDSQRLAVYNFSDFCQLHLQSIDLRLQLIPRKLHLIRLLILLQRFSLNSANLFLQLG